MKNKNTVYLTQEGLDNLKKELDDLINVRRPENVQAITSVLRRSFRIWEAWACAFWKASAKSSSL